MMDMRKSKYSEEEATGFMRQAETGAPIREIGRKHGFSDISLYNSRSMYLGMDTTQNNRVYE
jgi:putative transposase